MIEIQNLSKSFPGENGKIEALNNINLSIPEGDIFGIIGMSGAGKSTLVRCINLLEFPTSGSVVIDGKDITKMNVRELRDIRRSVTMIFQGFNLLMQRTCLANICFPLELHGIKHSEAKKRAYELLDIVGLPDKAESYPAQLSGGQQQRIAIARALATNPKVLLCDEATSALDPTTTHSILELIRDINTKLGITVIIITHQMSIVEEICRHVAILDSGRVAEVGEVSEVFSNPKSLSAKRLVFPDGDNQLLKLAPNEHRLRVVFDGSCAAGSPFIARMVIECGIEANILGASTRSINGKVYGNMLLGISGDDNTVQTVKNYLCNMENVLVTEITDDISKE